MSTEQKRTILVATDDDDTLAEIEAALADERSAVARVRAGAEVRPAVLAQDPDLVICDLQIGNMGGVAATLDLRLEEGAGRMGRRPIMLVLDRVADEFLARRSGADDWVLKPLDALRIRRCAEKLLAAADASMAD